MINLEQHVDIVATKNLVKLAGYPLLRWLGAIILLIVGYVHMALFLNMMSLRLLPVLFLINGIGAFIAMIGVLINSRWIGWIFGIVISGGAAITKIAMNTIPGGGLLLMGMPSRMNRPRMQMGNVGGQVGPYRGGQMHNVLPLFTNITTLATISIVIELVFVVLAIYVLVVNKRNLANK